MTELVLQARQLRRAGHTTDSIAARLNVTPRHVRRLLAGWRRLAQQRLVLNVEQDLREDFERMASYLARVDELLSSTTDPTAVKGLILAGGSTLRTKHGVLLDLHVRRPLAPNVVNVETLARARTMSTEAVQAALADRARHLLESLTGLSVRPLE